MQFNPPFSHCHLVVCPSFSQSSVFILIPGLVGYPTIGDVESNEASDVTKYENLRDDLASQGFSLVQEHGETGRVKGYWLFDRNRKDEFGMSSNIGWCSNLAQAQDKVRRYKLGKRI